MITARPAGNIRVECPREYPRPEEWSRDPELREVIEQVDNVRNAYVRPWLKMQRNTPMLNRIHAHRDRP
jgi:hypothetical protein